MQPQQQQQRQQQSLLQFNKLPDIGMCVCVCALVSRRSAIASNNKNPISTFERDEYFVAFVPDSAIVLQAFVA